MKVSYLSVLIRALEMQTRFADPEVGLHVFANSAWSVVYGCGVSPVYHKPETEKEAWCYDLLGFGSVFLFEGNPNQLMLRFECPSIDSCTRGLGLDAAQKLLEILSKE